MIVLIVCSGCATVEIKKEIPPSQQESFSNVQLGMTHQQVTALINEKIVIGFEVDPVTGNLKAIETQRWYSSEKVLIGQQEYQIDEYLMLKNIGEMFDAHKDLFPFGYKDGVLVAKGLKDIEALKKDEK